MPKAKKNAPIGPAIRKLSRKVTKAPEVQTQVIQRGHRIPSSAGAKVTVYCKLPAGLRIHADKMVPSRELVMGGGSREVMIAERVGEEILINGTAAEFGKTKGCLIINGFAVTPGVDKETWDAWYRSNINSAYVKNNLIYASEKKSMGEGFTKEHKDALTGLEPFEQEGDRRAPRPGRKNIGVIATADAQDD